MDIDKIYEELDALKYPEIEGYLRDKIKEAKEKDVFEVYVPLLNELIGFFRDSTQFDKGCEVKSELLAALDHYGQHGTMNMATSLLNIANFDRAAGAYEESLSEFGKCEEIYHGLLADGDYLWAGLYNNKSLLYQEMGDNLAAIGALQNALYIVKEIPGREIEVATTYVNIAQSFASLGQIEEAKSNIAEALKIFEAGGNTDYHYSGACAVCGAIAYAEGEYEKAAGWYDKAADIVRRIMGENDNVRLLGSAAAEARSMVKIEVEAKGLDICRSYYEKFGAPMIHEKFGAYEDKIAVGLFGEGSDCFGFDDEISRDHDWGPGFMILIRRGIYDEIGEALRQAYDELPDEYLGYRRYKTAEGDGRVGVICIEDVLCRYLPELFGDNDRSDLASALGWLNDKELIDSISGNRLEYVHETLLAQFVNGQIWRDDTGVITAIRDKVAQYYDDAVWLHKLGVSLILTG
ncbi:MAG: tetratricopeptide repeat protein, partial [Lachnospiraceae bacterium]|nr:tetratricopeptide repeat protein [Lachnospiraceae bacterium]